MERDEDDSRESVGLGTIQAGSSRDRVGVGGYRLRKEKVGGVCGLNVVKRQPARFPPRAFETGPRQIKTHTFTLSHRSPRPLPPSSCPWLSLLGRIIPV